MCEAENRIQKNAELCRFQEQTECTTANGSFQVELFSPPESPVTYITEVLNHGCGPDLF